MENDSQNSAPQPSPQVPALKKWYQHNGLIAIIILAVIGAIICCYYYYLNSHAQPCFNKTLLLSQIKNFPQPDNGKCPTGYVFDSLYCAGAPTWCQPNKSTGVIASSTPEALNGWQTYTNPTVNFSFQYPSEALTQAIAQNAQNQNSVEFGIASTTYAVTMYPEGGTSLDEWIKNDEAADSYSTDYNQITIGNSPAYVNKTQTDAFIESNGNIYEIDAVSAAGVPTNMVNDPIYLRLLSSFQLTGPTSSATTTPTQTNTSNWQTYTNSIYGIQIKYPTYLLLNDEAPDGADLNLTNVATTTYWQGITIQIFNNPDNLNPSDWWSKNQTTQTCASDPKPGQIAGFDSIEMDTDAKCIEFPKDNFPQIRSIFLFYKNRVVEFGSRNVPDTDQIVATTDFTNHTNSVVSNGLISYDDNNQLFTVTQKQFKVLDVFTPDYLENSSSGCYGATHPLSYYQTVLSKFLSSDLGIYYDFNFIGKSQDSGVYEVTVIPNKPGYQNSDQFNADFGLCDAGDRLYPFLLNSKNLLFIPACGTGYDDGSGLPHGCVQVKNFVENSIKLNK